MFKNFSFEKTPEVKKNWFEISEDARIKKILECLKENALYKIFTVVKARDDGQVILKFEQQIPNNERSLILLGLEKEFKKKIDSGIVIWCETIADKSKLRQLRGVKILS
jgi:hypothetical protein